MYGVFDANIKDMGLDIHYQLVSDKMKKGCSYPKEYGTIFKLYDLYAQILSVKATLGEKLRNAYKAENYEELSLIREKILKPLKEKLIEARELIKKVLY